MNILKTIIKYIFIALLGVCIAIAYKVAVGELSITYKP